jgi:hypothetical protein
LIKDSGEKTGGKKEKNDKKFEKIINFYGNCFNITPSIFFSN